MHIQKHSKTKDSLAIGTPELTNTWTCLVENTEHPFCIEVKIYEYYLIKQHILCETLVLFLI